MTITQTSLIQKFDQYCWVNIITLFFPRWRSVALSLWIQ